MDVKGCGFPRPFLFADFTREKTVMVEVKADALEQSFEQFEDEDDGVAALKAELEALKAKIAAGVIAAQRPALDGVKSAEASAFVDQYLRRGIESGLETKAIGSSSDSIGGYAVPQEIDAVIDATLTAISPIRAIANVVKVGSAGYRKLIASGGTPSGFVGFEDARSETNTPAFTEIVPPSGELYANPAVSQQMLDDAMFDVEKFLANEIATEFARAEGAAFVAGSGINQPLGFLGSPTSSALDAARPMGTLQTLGTGVAGGFPASDPEDALIDLMQSLRAPYRQGAVFVMNSAVAAEIRKFKTSTGAFLFQPSLAAGQPATLLGYPLIEAEDMPDIAAGSLSIAFGNFKAGYVIAERNATSILRDPYTHKPYVHFYATQALDSLVDGTVEEPAAPAPPASPALGACYIVGESPTDAWAGMPQCVAAWTSGGWRFVQPFEGMSFYVRSAGSWAVYRGATWEIGMLRGDALIIGGQQVVGPRAAAIASASGGAAIDAEARAVLDQILNAMRQHGLIET
jgi:HK97 family phage major capsid protein